MDPKRSKNANSKSDDVEQFSWRRITAVFVVVLFVGLLFGLLPQWFLAGAKTEKYAASGLFGDSFGFVNALLSSLGLAGVLITLWMQKGELRLQREEMRLTREQHQRMAKAQEESENRLFLAAYVNAIAQLRQYGEWRMTHDPARREYATFPVVEGLVIQARVGRSLHSLIKELDPQISKACPSIAHVASTGSHVWQLERILGIYLGLQQADASYRSRASDPDVFREATRVISGKLDELRSIKESSPPKWHSAIDQALADEPNPDWVAGDIFASTPEATEARRRYYGKLDGTVKNVLSLVMSMCFE